MTVQYDLSDLVKKYGFNVRETEKTYRVANILRGISQVDFLRNRLGLCGGTPSTSFLCTAFAMLLLLRVWAASFFH